MSSETHTTSIVQLVSFIINEEEYGIDILNVQEIIRTVDISRVPNSLPFVEGVINLRGKIVPVIDLRKRFALPTQERGQESRIIVVELGERVVGFLVDRVREVLRVENGVIEPATDLVFSVEQGYITGVAKLDDRLLILLDLQRVLTFEEKQLLEEDELALTE